MSEQWKDVSGYEGIYQVSDLGRCRNATGRFLAPNRITSGYLAYHLHRAGARKAVTAHKLVAQAFLPPLEGATEINHLNGDKSDNREVNLQRVTRLQNVRHAREEGLHDPAKNRRRVVALRSDGFGYFFVGQREAEIFLRGRATGGVSWALKVDRPVYGLQWSHAT
jgi:hypothetical protein